MVVFELTNRCSFYFRHSISRNIQREVHVSYIVFWFWPKDDSVKCWDLVQRKPETKTDKQNSRLVINELRVLQEKEPLARRTFPLVLWDVPARRAREVAVRVLCQPLAHQSAQPCPKPSPTCSYVSRLSVTCSVHLLSSV